MERLSVQEFVQYYDDYWSLLDVMQFDPPIISQYHMIRKKFKSISFPIKTDQLANKLTLSVR